MSEMGERMNGGAVRDDRSPENEAILVVKKVPRGHPDGADMENEIECRDQDQGRWVGNRRRVRTI